MQAMRKAAPAFTLQDSDATEPLLLFAETIEKLDQYYEMLLNQVGSRTLALYSKALLIQACCGGTDRAHDAGLPHSNVNKVRRCRQGTGVCELRL
jgi:hypothetical protein